ncbi:hypothetical protein Nepgr_017683 [Nepenthes gracilis]|uniref:Uncharacterized protein n=1 Tax=Nepenthes gracilis TaxID=150966 RepID=A0AAD3SSS4_NEPGR|nr:hypothetical protein Nepgr_017683 [Nepenthes gracilis]
MDDILLRRARHHAKALYRALISGSKGPDTQARSMIQQVKQSKKAAIFTKPNSKLSDEANRPGLDGPFLGETSWGAAFSYPAFLDEGARPGREGRRGGDLRPADPSQSEYPSPTATRRKSCPAASRLAR